MSSRAFVRRGRNNLKDGRKGIWSEPQEGTPHSIIEEPEGASFRQSHNPIHKIKDTEEEEQDTVLEAPESGQSEPVCSELSQDASCNVIEEAETPAQAQRDSEPEPVEALVRDSARPASINPDDYEVENADGEWVEYHSLRERLSSLRIADRSTVFKAAVALFLAATMIIMSFQCILMKKTYDSFNSRIMGLQSEFAVYQQSLDKLEQLTQDQTPVASSAEPVAPVEKKEEAKRHVYLTFDDGPSSKTDAILDILDEYGVKATFFVCGKPQFSDEYKRIVDEGHTIGMHSYSHKYETIYESLDSFQTDMHKIQNLIFDETGVWSTIYRFPGGSSNTLSGADMSDLIAYLGRENIRYFDWNVYGGDNISSDLIVSNVTANIGEFNNCMILLHDASDKQETVDALPGIIEYIQGLEDTEIVPITEDTVPVQHKSN